MNKFRYGYTVNQDGQQGIHDTRSQAQSLPDKDLPERAYVSISEIEQMMMNDTAPTLLTALEAIKAERDALRNGQVGRITMQAVDSHPVTLPPPEERYLAPQEHVTAQKFKSQIKIRNWKRAFFIMSVVGPLLGFLGSWLVFTGLKSSSPGGLAAAGSAGFSDIKADKLDKKENQLTLADLIAARRNCTALFLDSRTGITTAGKCAPMTQPASPRRSGQSMQHRQPLRGRQDRRPANHVVSIKPVTVRPASTSTTTVLKPLRPRIVPIKVQPVRPRGIIKRQWQTGSSRPEQP